MKRISIALLMLLLAAPAWARMGVGMMGGGVASRPSDIDCTGSNTFLRGANSSGDTEEFDYGTDDFCASDWAASGTTGVNTYSTAEYKFGTHSLSITDDSSTSAGRFYADHGSAQTSQYYRLYIKIPSNFADNGAIFSFVGVGKYNTTTNGTIRLVEGDAGYVMIGSASTAETITLNTGVWNRIEFSVSDSDGSGAGYTSYIIKAWDSSGIPIETSAGGGDYEVGYTTTTDQFRYFHIMPGYNNSTSTTIYIDSIKNCDGWCGAE